MDGEPQKDLHVVSNMCICENIIPSLKTYHPEET